MFSGVHAYGVENTAGPVDKGLDALGLQVNGVGMDEDLNARYGLRASAVDCLISSVETARSTNSRCQESPCGRSDP